MEDFWLLQILCPVCIVSFSWNVFLSVHLSCSSSGEAGLSSSERREKSWHQGCGKEFLINFKKIKYLEALLTPKNKRTLAKHLEKLLLGVLGMSLRSKS